MRKRLQKKNRRKVQVHDFEREWVVTIERTPRTVLAWSERHAVRKAALQHGLKEFTVRRIVATVQSGTCFDLLPQDISAWVKLKSGDL